MFSQETLVDPAAYEDLISSGEENSENTSDIHSELEVYKQNPININTASEEELGQLHLLSYLQIRNILEYRSKYKGFVSVNELAGVEGLDEFTLTAVLPYVIAEQTGLKGDTVSKINQFIYTGLKGNGNSFSKKDSPSQPFALRCKYYTDIDKKISFKLIAENDVGEKFLSGPYKSFDYVSASVMFKGSNKLKKLIVGDFSFTAGQGLVSWSGFNTGISGFFTSNHGSQGFRQWTSFNEPMAYRGVASAIKVNRFELSAFVSYKNRDVICDIDSNGQTTSFSSFDLTGYHISDLQIDRRGKLQELVYGSDVKFKTEMLKLGVVFSAYKNNLNYLPTDKFYNYFNTIDKQGFNTGIYYSFNLRKIRFYGEEALNSKNATAFINGIELAPNSDLMFIVQHRYYSPEYYAPYANANSQNGKVKNENGLLSGVQVLTPIGVSIKAYVDLFSWPWLKYAISSPSKGEAYMVQVTYTNSVRWSVMGRFSYSQKPTDIEGKFFPEVKDVVTKKYRIHNIYSPVTSLALNTRLDLTQSVTGDGYLMYQEVSKSGIAIFPYSLSFRYTYFDTPDWDNRVYSYERELDYNYPFRVYYGQGYSIYGLLKAKIYKKVNAGVKYEYTLSSMAKSDYSISGHCFVYF